MIFKCLPTGMFSSNCYIVGSNGEGVIIDPGVKSEEIMKEVGAQALRIKYIILTHAHIDHICSLDEIKEKLNAEVALHENEAEYLLNSKLNGSAFFGESRIFQKADLELKDGSMLEVGELKFKIIHTPGHTRGSMCIKVGNLLFTGDTLFQMSIGRTDLPGGEYSAIIDSITNKLMKLDDDVTVYPGHGFKTTIGDERKSNPFIK